jgi:hypothetical protein
MYNGEIRAIIMKVVDKMKASDDFIFIFSRTGSFD